MGEGTTFYTEQLAKQREQRIEKPAKKPVSNTGKKPARKRKKTKAQKAYEEESKGLLRETETRLENLVILQQRLADEASFGDCDDPVLLAMKREVRLMENALRMTESDPYHKILAMKYMDGWKDEELALHFHCETSTIWRNRGRLMMMLCVYLYGSME